MKNLKAITISFFLGILWVAVSCKKNDSKEEDKDKPTKDYPGFNLSKERPKGALFQYPAGVSVVGSVLKGDYDCIEEGDGLKRFYGIGAAVRLCINFYNDNNTAVNLVFPPGTVWICTTGEAQNGISPTRVSIELPPKQHYFAIINACCINIDREHSPNYTYETTPVVTQHPGMQELFKVLEKKKINYEDYGGRRRPTEGSQGSVWRAISQVAENKKIKDAIWAEINALPNR